MDGLLVIDKPPGPTSHDVVARVRRVLRERRIGHTGTLDPLASGVLPLVIGRATRLARFLSASDKTYEATVALGLATESGDAEGLPAGISDAGPLPDRIDVQRALDAFRGTYLQRPPALSAKKVGGVRSYKLARRAVSATVLQPVEVTVSALDLLSCDGHLVRLRIVSSAGFYVRSLARDLGEALGVGAHLAALRRVASGDLTLDLAIPLPENDEDDDRERTMGAIVPMARMLTAMPSICLSAGGVTRVGHGQPVRPEDVIERAMPSPVPGPESRRPGRFVRLVDERGELVAIAEPLEGSALLHPAVVLM